MPCIPSLHTQVSEVIPGFICPADFNTISRVLKVYQHLRDVETHIRQVDSAAALPTGETRCAWANGRVLGGCTSIATPYASNPLVQKLESALFCSLLGDDRALCSNV